MDQATSGPSSQDLDLSVQSAMIDHAGPSSSRGRTGPRGRPHGSSRDLRAKMYRQTNRPNKLFETSSDPLESRQPLADSESSPRQDQNPNILDRHADRTQMRGRQLHGAIYRNRGQHPRRRNQYRDGNRTNHQASVQPVLSVLSQRGKSSGNATTGNSRLLMHESSDIASREPCSSSKNQDEENQHHPVRRRFLRDREAKSSKEHNPVESSETVQSEISENQFKSNTFECMICCDNIHRNNPIWYCTSCYNIFHMKCSIEWCNKSIKSRDEALASAQFPSLGDTNTGSRYTNQLASVSERPGSSRYPNYRNERQKVIEWPCPACRKILYVRPGKYKCYCAKVMRPEVNRHLTPHSCGQICGRKRPDTECPHTCNTMCHPGRCNPCTLTSKKTCHCGKSTQEVKCSTRVGSCGLVCDKLLSCGRHRCPKICHDDRCNPCKEILLLKCHCASKEISIQCQDHSRSNDAKSEDRFSCDKVCDKLLDCKNHRCTKPCHPGPNCPSCPLLSQNLKTCPCGSKSLSKLILEDRRSCMDPLPTCESKCNKQLICGPEKNHHRCQKKCHTGSCPPCKQKSSVKCECSQTSRSIECALMFEKTTNEDGCDPKDGCNRSIKFEQSKYLFNCEMRCNMLKNCGKHKCQEKCCHASRDPNSSAHICTQVCNKKLPCGLHNCQEVCHPGLCGDCPNIGWNELSCHCSASVMYPPIPCGARPPVCHRPCRRDHDCGHPVKHECHDDTEKCAPCTLFTKKSCFCGADSKESVYCYLSGYSCGRTCRKQLSCRQHTCKKVCHEGDCENPNNRGVIVCSQLCPMPRFLCSHPCGLPCHSRTPCPTTNCTKTIEIRCECGNRADRIECHKLSRDSDNRNKIAMLSINRPNQDSVVIDLTRKPINPPPVSDKSINAAPIASRKKLDCDETCALYKRNKALAEALDIAQPNLKSTTILGEDPLKLLREATSHDYKFVAATYNSLANFVKSAQASERRFIFLQLPPADKLKREVIHELAYHFNCTSESRDQEPERYVIVKASRNKSIIPEFTIEQLLPVDD